MKVIYKELTNIGQKMDLRIDVIGSFAYGLWTPYSDIDIAFTNTKSESIIIERTLLRIFKAIKDQSRALGVKEIYYNTGIPFPNIRLELESYLNCRKLDITIFQKKNNGEKYVQFVKEGLTMYPTIRPIFFTFHRILQSFSLHNPARGGVKTYAIYLMVMWMVSQNSVENIGQILVNLFYYYTYYYNYDEKVN